MGVELRNQRQTGAERHENLLTDQHTHLKNESAVPSNGRFSLRSLRDSHLSLSLILRKHVIGSLCSWGPNITNYQMSVCDCVTDEPECLPWGELSLVNGDHSPPVFLRLQFSLSELFWQFLLRGPRLRTIIRNVFVSYLKNWQRSQIAPIIHISGFWNSCTLKASHDCISFLCQ